MAVDWEQQASPVGPALSRQSTDSVDGDQSRLSDRRRPEIFS